MQGWIRRGYIEVRGKDGVWLMEETGKERKNGSTEGRGKEGVLVLEDQEPDEERIHEKKFWKGQKEGYTKGSGKGWKNGFIVRREFQTDQERRGERKHGRKRNGYKWIQGRSGK
jgi:hypothetical protein